MRRILEVKPGQGYTLSLLFDDGVRADIDLSARAGQGVFAAWADLAFFRSVTVGEQGELQWGDNIDLCPDALYLEATGMQPEGLFPKLRGTHTHA